LAHAVGERTGSCARSIGDVVTQLSNLSTSAPPIRGLPSIAGLKSPLENLAEKSTVATSHRLTRFQTDTSIVRPTVAMHEFGHDGGLLVSKGVGSAHGESAPAARAKVAGVPPDKLAEFTPLS